MLFLPWGSKLYPFSWLCRRRFGLVCTLISCLWTSQTGVVTRSGSPTLWEVPGVSRKLTAAPWHSQMMCNVPETCPSAIQRRKISLQEVLLLQSCPRFYHHCLATVSKSTRPHRSQQYKYSITIISAKQWPAPPPSPACPSSAALKSIPLKWDVCNMQSCQRPASTLKGLEFVLRMPNRHLLHSYMDNSMQYCSSSSSAAPRV